MKKTLLFLLSMMSIVSLQANAQGIGDLIDKLGTDVNFGYTTNQKISIKQIGDDKVTIESPTIKSQDNQNISTYTIMYSEYPLTEILDNTTLLSQSKEKAITITTTNSTFTGELGIADGLNPTIKYYVFIIPKDASGNLGDVSNELWFRISDKTHGEAGSNEVLTAAHNAAGADMSLANITHTINNNTITLKWIAINGSDNIDLSVMTPGSSSFSKVTTMDMEAETYGFIASTNGEYIFQFTPDNGGKQVNYTVQVGGIIPGPGPNPPGPNPKPQIIKVPKTGPTENMIIIFAVGLLGYLGYKKLYRKAK